MNSLVLRFCPHSQLRPRFPRRSCIHSPTLAASRSSMGAYFVQFCLQIPDCVRIRALELKRCQRHPVEAQSVVHAAAAAACAAAREQYSTALSAQPSNAAS